MKKKQRVKGTKLRPLGEVLLDLEIVLEEMTDTDKHSLQYGDVLQLVFNWLEVHAPHAKEEYLDGTNPIFRYGSK